MGTAESDDKKFQVRWGGGTRSSWPNKLRWNMYFSYRIHFVNKWIKYEIQITCPVFNYVFQILVFQLLDNSANKHAEQPRFFSCFTSGSCSLAKYTKLCMVWQQNIRNMLWAFHLPPNPGYVTAKGEGQRGQFPHIAAGKGRRTHWPKIFLTDKRKVATIKFAEWAKSSPSQQTFAIYGRQVANVFRH